MDFDALGLCRGDRVDVRSGFVGIGPGSTRLVVDCRAAPRWTPARPGQARAGSEPATRRRRGGGEPRCLARLRPDGVRDVMSALQRPRCRSAMSLPRVVGRGPGSTPAGDDVLVGILAVLSSPHSGPAGSAARPTRCAARCARCCREPRTSAGICCGRRRDGLFGRAVHELVCGVDRQCRDREQLTRGSPPSRRHGRDVGCGHVRGPARRCAFVSSDRR